MSLKKVELHVHLEGTISPELAYNIAKRNKLDIPDGLVSSDGESYLSNDFLHFLSVYDTLAAIIKSPQDYYDITFDYLKQNALNGAIYIEMMYSPDHAEQSSGIPSIEHLHAIQKAIDDAEEKLGIIGRIIITAVRHFGQESAEKVAKQGVKDKLPCVTGYGLGGDEGNFPPRLFEKAYHIANEGGLMCTVHAGEFAPAEGMIEAMNYLPIKRIGHGVRGIESPDAIAMLKDKNISLEICPTSNVFLGLYPDIKHHPLPKFLNEDIRISINSDDPPFMSTHLAKEYELVQANFGFSDEEMNRISLMAIEDAFVDEQTKAKLKEKLYA